MGEHLLIGRPPARGATFKQRRLKPSAMLVRALEIEIGGPFQFIALFEHKGMGDATIKPDVQNVAHLLIV